MDSQAKKKVSTRPLLLSDDAKYLLMLLGITLGEKK